MSNTTNIFIVTPSFNSEKYINRTISSVISQVGNFNIHYHIQDGGSKDGTMKIVEKWENIIHKKDIPISCLSIDFTYSSEKDEGMYDAICKAFKKRTPTDDWWLGWINSDDYFIPGAFAHLHLINETNELNKVNWITPYIPAIAKDNIPINNINPRPISKYLLSEGLCDGQHWDFIQQEGTFFRANLWKKIDITNKFRKLKYAGDWSLWKEMAKYEQIYQTSSALAVFNITEGQLSATHRSEYTKEIEKLRSNKNSILKLEEIAINGTEAIILSTNWKTKSLTQSKINLKDIIIQKITNLINQKKPSLKINKGLKTHGNIIAYDHEWQHPAITEKYCYDRVSVSCRPPDDLVYIAFPWATLIDLKHNKKDSDHLDTYITEISNHIKQKNPKTVVTSCQHIFAKKFIDIFKAIGITDIFWSHADIHEKTIKEINIHPLPLYPVQRNLEQINKAIVDRKYLFSFIGARDDKWYLSNTRSIIIDELKHPKALIVGKDEWHYKKIVYDQQIYKTANSSAVSSIDEQYKDILRNSVFSLCPSGSGPNSIRLWESLEFDSIPIILANTYLPPGQLDLWKEAVIFCKEDRNEILNLPKKLELLLKQPDLLNKKLKAIKQLKLLYGFDTFITDIVKLFCKSYDSPKPSIKQNSIEATSKILQLVTYIPKVNKRIQTAQDINNTNGDPLICSTLLITLSSDIILNREEFLKMYENVNDIRKAIRIALKNSSPQIVKHFLSTASSREISINL